MIRFQARTTAVSALVFAVLVIILGFTSREEFPRLAEPILVPARGSLFVDPVQVSMHIEMTADSAGVVPGVFEFLEVPPGQVLLVEQLSYFLYTDCAPYRIALRSDTWTEIKPDVSPLHRYKPNGGLQKKAALSGNHLLTHYASPGQKLVVFFAVSSARGCELDGRASISGQFLATRGPDAGVDLAPRPWQ